MRTLLLAIVLLTTPLLSASAQRSLFNGKDLSGWVIHGTEKWYVEDGELVCESGPDEEYGYLATENSYKNFELTLEFKQEADGNSGVFFRSSLDGTRISGWQVEVAPPGNDTGGIYESYGRGWLITPEAEKDEALNMGEWNQLRVRVIGTRVRTWLNGVPMIVLDDAKIGRAYGQIALQIHDGGGIKVRWRNIKVKELPAYTGENSFLYRVQFLRAAPGRLEELIALIKQWRNVLEVEGEVPPYWMRHSQGDQWDLLLLYPIESYTRYYDERLQRSRKQALDYRGISESDLLELASYREELFAYGPNSDVIADRFSGAGLFHFEIFRALAGHRNALLEQRIMENDYYNHFGHPGNLVFAVNQGGPWDAFTLGFYRDLKHFAENGDITAEEEDAAAQAGGFESASQIGFYLRSLLLRHQDTLASAIR